MMAVVLPVLCFAALLKKDDLRESFLTSAVATGFFIALSTELLSVFDSIAYIWLVLCWTVYLSGLAVWRYRSQPTAEPVPRPQTTVYQNILLALLLCIFGVSGITAIVAAPNNFDSLTYHLPRIMHWIQNRSVEHYPTHIDRQLVLAPFSEFGIMHLQILSGGDRFDNCVQWFSMVGSALGVSLIVRALGGSLNSQIVSAVIAVSVPMGLLQSTSTQNDYAVTFWLVCLTYYVIKAKQCPDARHALLVGLSLAFAIFTKGTAYLVALPFMLVYTWVVITATGFKKATAYLLVVAAMILLVNGGHYARNMKVYGNPISPGTGNDIICKSVGVRPTISCITKNVATQLVSGFRDADLALAALTGYVHDAIGVQINDPDLTADRDFVLQTRTHEDFASNHLHMMLMLVAAVALVLGRKRYPRDTMLFAAAAILSFVVLSAGIKWNPFISRYFLPVLVISAPFLSLIYDVPKIRPVVNACAILLLLCSFPVLAENEMRPLLGEKSVLVTERIDQYFITRPQARQYFAATATMIKQQGVTNIGILDRDGNMWEYVLWVMLKSDGDKYRIEHVDVQNRSGGIKLIDFSKYQPVRI